MSRARIHQFLVLFTLLLIIGTKAGAQVCTPKQETEPIKTCEPTAENPDPCPLSPDITIHFSCRIEDCIIHVFAAEHRKPFLEKVQWKLSDGFTTSTRGPEPRIRRIFPFPGLNGTKVWAEVTPYWKDTGIGRTARQEYAMQGDTPYFGHNTNFWGLTVEYGTDFGNPHDWSYHWTYGDGTVGQNASWIATCKTYDLPGRYLVSLRMTQGNNCAPAGCQEFTVQRYIDVPNTPPLSSFTYTNAGRRLTVDATASRDEPAAEESRHTGINYNCGFRRTNSQLTYEWDWGDGSFGSGMNATHDYAAPGIYKVSLLVRDRIGATHTSEKTVSMPEDPPKPSFSFNCHGGVCDFDAGVSTIAGAQYHWTFDQVITGGTVPQGTVTTTTPTMSRLLGNGIFRVKLQVQSGASFSPPASRELRTSTRSAEGLVFVPMVPCRLVDTREINVTVASGQNYTIPVRGGLGNRCIIPTGISAIAVNLATDIRENSAAGRSWLHAYKPGWGEANQTIYHSFNPALANGIRATNTIIEVANDQFRVVPVMPGGGTVRLIADATGYFVKTTHPSAAEGLRFETSPLCTFAQSWATNQPLIMNTPRYVALGKCLGTEAPKAASLVFTALNPTTEGFVKITPSNFTSDYVFSSINMWGGKVLRNGWITSLGSTSGTNSIGDFRLTTGPVEGATAHYELALNGRFLPNAPLVYYPIDPCRAVNTTRPNDTGYRRALANTSQHYQIRGNCGVPKGAVAAVVNVTAVNPAGAGDISLFPSDHGLYPGHPQQLSIYQNFYPNDDMTTGAIVALSPQHELDLGVKARFFDSDIYVDVLGYFGPPGLTNAAETETPEAEQ